MAGSPPQAANSTGASSSPFPKDEGGRMKDESDKRLSDSSFILPPSSFGKGLLDAPVLLAACGGDPAMLRKMCRSLQSRVPEHLAAVRDALHDQDAPRLRGAAR